MQDGIELRRLSSSGPRFSNWSLVAIGAILTGILWWSGFQQWYFIPILVALLVWEAVSLCKVTLAGQTLRISNYRGEIAVPLTAIDSIKERRWARRRRGAIILRFDRNFGIGRTVEFMPDRPNRNLTGDGPTAAELKQLVADAMREQEIGARHR